MSCIVCDRQLQYYPDHLREECDNCGKFCCISSECAIIYSENGEERVYCKKCVYSGDNPQQAPS